MNKRQLSEQAQVAKLCKQYCKSIGVKCSAKSDSFSMGDSVDVTIYDQPPEIFNKIQSEFSKYQYGHFDGMQDMYEISNRRDDIPQTKYLSISNEYSEEYHQKAWEFLRSRMAGLEDAPENYHDCSNVRLHEDWAQNSVWRLLRGSYDSRLCAEFWESILPQKQVSHIANTSAHIEQHTHTKKGFMMYMVVLDTDLSRDDFMKLRNQAAALGGWYSRKWGSTPGGFAFKELSLAEAFLNTLSNPTNDPPKGNKSEKFRSMADKLESKILECFSERQTNTPKRLAQAENKRLEGERLKRDQQVLYALADLWDSGEVPEVLKTINTKSDVHELTRSILEPVSNGWHSYHVDTEKPALDTPEALAAWDLLKPKTAAEIKQDEIRQKLNGLQFSNIPGYFPTPEPIIELMLEYADIQPDSTVLEPSAGHGAIADYIAKQNPEREQIFVCEVNYTLREILESKGHKLICDDFKTIPTHWENYFDRIVMNPPFENSQDIDHIMLAYHMLNNDGVLVSVMSSGPFFRNDSKAVNFRDWLEDVNAEIIDLPDNSFKESNTGVSTKLVIIRV